MRHFDKSIHEKRGEEKVKEEKKKKKETDEKNCRDIMQCLSKATSRLVKDYCIEFP